MFNNIFKCIFFELNVSIEMSLKYDPKSPINNAVIGSDNGLVINRWQTIIFR